MHVRESHVRLHVMGRACMMHLHLRHGNGIVASGDRSSRSVIVSPVVSSYRLARVSARYARAQPVRRDSETITGRHVRTARCAANVPAQPPLTRAREPTGSAGQTIVREATGARWSKLEIRRTAHRSCSCSIKVRNTACLLVSDALPAWSAESFDKSAQTPRADRLPRSRSRATVKPV